LHVPGLPGTQRVRRLQHLPEQQCSSGLQQETVLPPLQTVSLGPQQYERSGSAHAEPSGQHSPPHRCSAGHSQWTSQHPLSPHTSITQVQLAGQQVGKQASDSSVQYFHPSSRTAVWHLCPCCLVGAARAGDGPFEESAGTAAVTTAPPRIRSARERGIGSASARARPSRNPSCEGFGIETREPT
jgi:hypothetical protein